MHARIRRDEFLRGYFEAFAWCRGAPLKMRDVARANMAAYGSLYHVIANKQDLVRGVDAGLSQWIIEKLSVINEPGDRTRHLLDWFERNEMFALGLAFWLTDRRRASFRKGEEAVADVHSAFEGICRDVAPTVALSVEQTRELLVEIMMLALIRFLAGKGLPTIASREAAVRTILDGDGGTQSRGEPDRYDADAEAIVAFECVQRAHLDD